MVLVHSTPVLTGLVTFLSVPWTTAASVIPFAEHAQVALGGSSDPSLELPQTNHPISSEDNADILTRPSWFTSTLMARRLLALSTSGVISTIFPDPLPPSDHAPASVAGLPVGLREYIADCDGALPAELSHGGNGDPTVLALRVGSTFKNIAAGSNLSLQVDWWDHLSDAGPVYPDCLQASLPCLG